MNQSDLAENELHEFFAGLADWMETATGYERRISRFEAPRFNVFDYIEPDENKVTEILADLLNPNGSHGQGDVFLQSFLRRIGFERPSGEEITVRTQHRTEWNRYIDLTITLGPHIVALENKISADEQPMQIADYMQWLKRAAKGRWLLVFLTPNGREPTECKPEDWNEARENGNAWVLSYVELSLWLRSCMNSVISDRVRSFIHDMGNWTENLRGGNMATDLRRQLILDFISKPNGGRYLATLLAVQDTSDAVRKGLISDFANTLEAKLKSQFPAWIFDSKLSESDLGAKSPGISIRKSSWPPNCWIGIEADSLGTSFGYGVTWKDASSDDREKLRSALISRLAKGKSSADWPWWDDVAKFNGVEVKKWNQSETIMLMAGNERQALVDHFANLFTDVYEAVKDVLEPGS